MKNAVVRQKGETHLWQGALTVQRIAALKKELLSALGQVDSVLIDISNATEIDPACMQLLCSAHRTFTQQHKRLAVIGREKFAKTFSEVGFARHIGCALDCNHSCLWVDQQSEPEISGYMEG